MRGNLKANNTSNPSWGTGTGGEFAELVNEAGLPTPHGEREWLIPALAVISLGARPELGAAARSVPPRQRPFPVACQDLDRASVNPIPVVQARETAVDQLGREIGSRRRGISIGQPPVVLFSGKLPNYSMNLHSGLRRGFKAVVPRRLSITNRSRRAVYLWARRISSKRMPRDNASYGRFIARAASGRRRSWVLPLEYGVYERAEAAADTSDFARRSFGPATSQPRCSFLRIWSVAQRLGLLFGKLPAGGQSFAVDLDRLRLRLSPARSMRSAL